MVKPQLPGGQTLCCLIYVSKAPRSLEDAALLAILESSWRHNQIAEVTGLLVYKESNFLHILEGTPEGIKETMGRITNDSRHNQIVVLLEQAITERLFSLWSMAFPNVNELTEEGLRKYSSYLYSAELSDTTVRRKVSKILFTFRSLFCFS